MFEEHRAQCHGALGEATDDATAVVGEAALARFDTAQELFDFVSKKAAEGDATADKVSADGNESPRGPRAAGPRRHTRGQPRFVRVGRMRPDRLLILAALLCVRCNNGGAETTVETGSTGSDGATGDTSVSSGGDPSGPTGDGGDEVTGSDGGDTVAPTSSEPVTTGATTTTAMPTTGGVDDSGDDSGTTTDEPPAAPAVHYVGRFDAGDPEHVRMGWSGVGAVFRFDGTAASVRLDDSGRYFTVVVDGEVQPTLATSPGEQTYPLAQGLAPGEHTVELYRRTEGSFGPTVLLGVELEGELLAPPPVERRIEIIGDSITCGFGNEGTPPCGFTAETENHYLTYGAVAARALGAELSTVAWSGKGVIYNYDKDVNDPLPKIYDRAIPGDGAPWDFSAWQPDAVVINLGTNDFSTDGDPPEDVFVPAYVDFLGHLRDVYPDAFILVVAPSLWGAEAQMVAGYLETVVAQRHADGDLEVAFTDINVEWIGAGCSGHPSVATHAGMADNHTEALKAQLGW